MEWYWWLAIMGVMFVVCFALAAYWWHKWHEMFMRGIYAVTGFVLGAAAVFVLLLIFGKISW
jgi:hypothetical protein